MTTQIMPLQRGKRLSIREYIMMCVVLSVASAFVGLNGILDLLVLGLWCGYTVKLFNTDDFYTLFLPLTLYEGLIVIPNVMAFFKLLSLIYVIKLILVRKFCWNGWSYILFFVLAWYAFLCLWEYLGGLAGFFIFICSVAAMCDTWSRFESEDMFERTMFFFLCMGLSCGLYGFLHSSSIAVVQNDAALSRFCGTANDPNIMGLKWVICLAITLYSSVLTNKWSRIGVVLVLSALILKTGSTTALIACAVLLIAFMFFRSLSIKKAVIFIAAVIVAVVVVLNLEKILLWLYQNNIMGNYAFRLLRQLDSLKAGDMSTLTSLRTEVWKGYMDYYLHQQDVLHQLFGGNVANIYGIKKNYSNMNWTAAPHNTNIDVLMCIGAAGLTLIWLYFISNMRKYLFAYYRNGDRQSVMKMTIKLVVLVYTLSISFFPSFGLMIFWLL